MKFTNKDETEAKQVYLNFMESYMNWDVKTYDSLLDDDFYFVGSAVTEEFLSRKGTTDFFIETGEQINGKIKLENRVITTQIIGSQVLVGETDDGYVLYEDEWIFYGRFRISCLLTKKENRWKLFHLHISNPDTKAQEGETIGTEQIAAENLQLRDAIKRRTVELEHKNKDLEIEASLERVRAVAMGMHKPDDLPGICEILFAELHKLGFNELRNSMINIHNDDEGTFINYDYSDEIGRSINHLTYNIHPLIKKQIKQIRSGKDAFSETSFIGKDLEDWKAFRKEIGEKDDPRIENIDALYYYFYSMGSGSIGISTFSFITPEKLLMLKRFRNVFDFAYRRYMDVSQAEEQAKEAQIELALERVRARTMAMQKSDELKEVIQVVYEQFVHLNIDIEHTGFILDYKARDDMHIWLADQNEVPSEVTIPYFDCAHWNSFKEAKEKGIDFFANLLSFEEKNKFYKDLFTLIPGVPKETWDYYFNCSGLAISTVLLENIGLYIENFSAIPYSDEENKTLLRFGKVFQQTYTRFLDLQKAEKQSRESQIELGLERVRARAMAMQNSAELSDLVDTVFKELSKLDFGLQACIINLIDISSMSNTVWMANPDIGNTPDSYFLKFEDYPFHHAMMDGYLKRKTKFIYVIEGTEKKVYDQYLFKDTEFRKIPQEAQNSFRALKKYVCSFTFSNFGGLQTIGEEPLSVSNLVILERFGKVFDLTYTRFNDLLKAEAQAREAKIETALERIRSRSMAMHKSEELADVAQVFFEQISLLTQSLDRFNILMPIQDGVSLEAWVTDQKGHKVSKQFILSSKKSPIVQEVYESWKQKKTILFLHLKGKRLQNWIAYINEVLGIPFENVTELKNRFITLVYFTHGYIGTTTHSAPNEETIHLIQRFCKVFEQTYTRFLDLEKAEAQARESEIELALERVRARTMAMQHSDELQETSFLLDQQVRALGIKTWGCAFNIYGEKESTEWFGNEAGVLPTYSVPRVGIFEQFYQKGKKGESLFIKEIAGEECVAHYEFMSTLPVVGDVLKQLKKNNGSFPTYQIDHVVYFKYGYLLFITREPVPEAYDIFKRFAKVFEQTYTRFLDLKKAEAQTRESEIELALERVRARTMAMQRSEELLDVATILFQQVKGLGVPQWNCGFNIWNTDDKEFTFYPGSPDGIIFPSPCKISLTEHPVFKRFDESRRRGDELLVYEKEGEEQVDHYQYMLSIPGVGEFLQSMLDSGFEFPKFQIDHLANFSYGNLVFITYEHFPEMHEVFKRFAKVFEQTYTRFLDLKKAEAQAREAQIEAAIEKVRSRSLAMHKPDELQEVITVVAEKLQELGVIFDAGGVILCTYFPDNKDVIHWIVSPDFSSSQSYLVPYFDNPIFNESWDSKNRGDDYFSKEFPVEAKNHFFEYAFEHSDYKHFPDEYKQYVLQAEKHTLTAAWSKNSSIIIPSLTEVVPSKSDVDIIIRFARVFEQAYTRFLDLQKAESQAREAQIEAALERVRSRTMAMHKSQELAETALVLYGQLKVLGNIPDRISIGLFKEETKEIELWGTDQLGSQLNQKFSGSWNQSKVMTKLYKGWKAGNDSFVADLSGQNLKVWLKYIREEMKLFVDDSHMKGRRVQQAAFFSHGFLLSTTNEPVSKEVMQLLIRFARVFSQTYTRFLDLQKAEAQAKEAQIENSLEKVRSRTMAMQHSDELPEAANNLFLQVQALGIPAWSAGYCIWENQDKKTASCNMSSEGEIQKSFILPTIGVGYNIYDPLQKGDTFYVEELGGEEIVKHYDFMRTLPGVGKILEELIEAGLSLPTFQIFHIVYFSHGYLMFITYEQVQEAHDIFKRFAKVFEQTYTRFLDLQKAEAQTKEAIKVASLDRVRGEIASMRSKADLSRITPLIWHELTTLEVPFIRCGVFIMNEPEATVQVYLSAPDGHSLATMNLPFLANALTKKTNDYWNRKKVYREHWNREEFINFMKSMMELGQIQSKETFQNAESPPESLDLQFVPFKQGMLYVGSSTPLHDDEIDLVQVLADAFAIAYDRYEDFSKLEKAKERIESALSELKATQSQLIQSEKMASLGELTAGIAHEIQNPLNFVNNFSEVSAELVDEMNDEIDQGNLDFAKEIATDLKQNLEKINHHGKRAGEIVKGMLQHSRTSSGQKELTDINVLADEYLRLAYHGLRAKDKSFNAKMESYFHPDLQQINVIPQDLGRVILNLITNAFYTVNERSKKGDASYQPRVTVSTNIVNNKIEIKVTDNGNGMPAKIKEKIFQPFFTTKPTGQGTGLGLSLSYDIVKAHGGEIIVETRENEGTKFIVQLPL